jgi:hypothetical protein
MRQCFDAMHARSRRERGQQKQNMGVWANMATIQANVCIIFEAGIIFSLALGA